MLDFETDVRNNKISERNIIIAESLIQYININIMVYPQQESLKFLYKFVKTAIKYFKIWQSQK